MFSHALLLRVSGVGEIALDERTTAANSCQHSLLCLLVDKTVRGTSAVAFATLRKELQHDDSWIKPSFEKPQSESESLNACGLFSDVSVDLAALSLFGDVAGFMDKHGSDHLPRDMKRDMMAFAENRHRLSTRMKAYTQMAGTLSKTIAEWIAKRLSEETQYSGFAAFAEMLPKLQGYADLVHTHEDKGYGALVTWVNNKQDFAAFSKSIATLKRRTVMR